MSVMKIVHAFPPNFALIKAALPNANEHVTYCYGDTIYRPDGQELPPDIEFHESIHSEQQGGEPDMWYAKYLTDPHFRLQQEIEAYGKQFAYAKQHIEMMADQAAGEGRRLLAGKNNLIRHALERMATALSGPEYGNLIEYAKAEATIRRYGRA